MLPSKDDHSAGYRERDSEPDHCTGPLVILPSLQINTMDVLGLLYLCKLIIWNREYGLVNYQSFLFYAFFCPYIPNITLNSVQLLILYFQGIKINLFYKNIKNLF